VDTTAIKTKVDVYKLPRPRRRTGRRESFPAKAGRGGPDGVAVGAPPEAAMGKKSKKKVIFAYKATRRWTTGANSN
jgi:hypothetical protein